MREILFLAQRMQMGYGVSVVLDSISRILANQGYRVGIACWSSDIIAPPYEIFEIGSSAEECMAIARKMNNPIVVAHTSPFFEVLPEMSKVYECWAYEHGDPTPHLFEDENDRIKLISNKQCNVYPNIKGVIAISNFIKYDIGFPEGKVVLNGCDHIADRGSKPLEEFKLGTNRKLRVGTLMRLGESEALYKGNQTFVDLYKKLNSREEYDFWVMGRGTQKDAELFEAQGIRVLLNGNEPEKMDYLRSLDVFVSCSLWEGCNLPLLEAQALGTAGIAFDVGAHPEMTPLLALNAQEMAAMIQAFNDNPTHLSEVSKASYHSVRTEFTWKKAAEDFMRAILE